MSQGGSTLGIFLLNDWMRHLLHSLLSGDITGFMSPSSILSNYLFIPINDMSIADTYCHHYPYITSRQNL